MTVLSMLPLATNIPSGLNATDMTVLLQKYTSIVSFVSEHENQLCALVT